nr:DNA directed RNA polymerase subunit 2 [Mimivirus sp.]
MKYQDHQEGCKMIQLSNLGNRKDYLVHRLVASYFIKREDPKHNSIKHIDGDKTNNHIDNLEWCYVAGVDEPEIKIKMPYYNPKTAIKPQVENHQIQVQKIYLLLIQRIYPRNNVKKEKTVREKIKKFRIKS